GDRARAQRLSRGRSRDTVRADQDPRRSRARATQARELCRGRGLASLRTRGVRPGADYERRRSPRAGTRARSGGTPRRVAQSSATVTRAATAFSRTTRVMSGETVTQTDVGFPDVASFFFGRRRSDATPH